MDKLYHVTSKENWNSIKDSGFLESRSCPWWNSISVSEKVLPSAKEPIKFDKYLVGLPNKSDSRWLKSGLYDLLKKCIKSNDIVQLEIQIYDASKGFVRDHYRFSPEFFIAETGLDLLNLQLSREYFLNSEEFELYNNSKINYFNSSISIDKYQNNFSIPEIWINQTTFVDDIIVSSL